MVKTANPNLVLDLFQDQVKESIEHYAQIQDKLKDDTPVAIRKSVAEDAAFRLGALWEVFQGRWHIACISKSPRRFVNHMQKELDKKVQEDWTRATVSALADNALNIPNRPTLFQIETMLDPTGRNISFKNIHAWKQSAVDVFDDPFKTKLIQLSNDPESESFLHWLKKLRNLLAHGSDSSSKDFTDACRVRPPSSQKGDIQVGLTGTRNDFLVRNNRARDLGAYLRALHKSGPKTDPDYGRARIILIHERLLSVSELLRT